MDAWTGARSGQVDEGTPGADDEHAARLREYYEDSWFDYRFLWLDPRMQAEFDRSIATDEQFHFEWR